MRLFHATNPRNRKNIKIVGLIRNRPHSGYGKTPERNAVYLYHINNVDVPCDLMHVFNEEVDVWEVVNIDTSKLISDEDSGKSSWRDSMIKMGTCAYIWDIPPSSLKYIGKFTTENDYIAWSKLEKIKSIRE